MAFPSQGVVVASSTVDAMRTISFAFLGKGGMDAERSLATFGTILMALGSIATMAILSPDDRATTGGGRGENGEADRGDDTEGDDIEGLDERMGQLEISKRPRETGDKLRLPPPPDVKRARFDEDEIKRRLRDEEQIRRIADQPGAEDFTSLPAHLRSAGGVEVYRAVYADRWTWRALTGALAFAHARGGAGWDYTMAKISSMLESSYIMDLPVTHENQGRVIEAFSGEFDVTRMSHAVLVDLVRSCTVQRLLFRFPALLRLIEPVPEGGGPRSRRLSPIAAFVKSRAEEVIEYARKRMYVTDVDSFSNPEADSVVHHSWFRPGSGQTLPLAGETVGISFSDHKYRGGYAFVLQVFGFPAEPVALECREKDLGPYDGDVDKRNWRIVSPASPAKTRASPAKTRAQQQRLERAQQIRDHCKNTALQIVVTTRSNQPEPHLELVWRASAWGRPAARHFFGERLLWANPLVEDAYVYSVLRRFVPEGRAYLSTKHSKLNLVVDILSSRLYAEPLLNLDELRTRAMYMAYVNGISKVVGLWNTEIAHARSKLENGSKRRSRRHLDPLETIELKMHDLKPYSQAVAELRHDGPVLDHLVRLLYRLMWKMWRTYARYEPARSHVVYVHRERWRDMLQFARDPTDATGHLHDPQGLPFDTDASDALYARYASGELDPHESERWPSAGRVLGDFEDEVKQLRQRAGRPLTSETWPTLKRFLFEKFDVVEERLLD